MPIQISPVISARTRGDGSFSVKTIDLDALGERASPVVLLDDFRVRGQPFGPHPHAGFSAVTYVLEDSQGSLRSRDSLGNDNVVGPGGIVWTEAASGVMHEEVPAESGRELHGLQIFVNLSAKNKLIPPKVLRLFGGEVPEWQDEAGGRVRVVVGSFKGVQSPILPAEPVDLLDIYLRQEVTFDLASGHNALAYVLEGEVVVRAGDREAKLSASQAVAISGSGGVTLRSSGNSHLVLLSGAEICEPIFARGPFIMNDRKQVEEANARYHAGAMGHLAPLPKH